MLFGSYINVDFEFVLSFKHVVLSIINQRKNLSFFDILHTQFILFVLPFGNKLCIMHYEIFYFGNSKG